KVPGSFPIHEVSPSDGETCADQRKIRLNGMLQHVVPAIDLPGLLAPGEIGAVTGGGEERAHTSPGRPDPFREVALRHKFQLDLPVPVQLVKDPGVGLAGEGADDLAHTPL